MTSPYQETLLTTNEQAEPLCVHLRQLFSLSNAPTFAIQMQTQVYYKSASITNLKNKVMLQILANHTYQILRPNFKTPKGTRRNDVFKSVEILYEC